MGIKLRVFCTASSYIQLKAIKLPNLTDVDDDDDDDVGITLRVFSYIELIAKYDKIKIGQRSADWWIYLASC